MYDQLSILFLAALSSAELLERLDLLSQMAAALLGSSRQSCQQRQLCQLGRRAAAAGAPLSDLISLAR